MIQKQLISISKKSLALAAIGLALAGCGSSDSGTVLDPFNRGSVANCPAGSYLSSWGCSTTSGYSFEYSCQMENGRVFVVNGKSACDSSAYFPIGYSISVRAGDQVSVLGSLEVGGTRSGIGGFFSMIGDIFTGDVNCTNPQYSPSQALPMTLTTSGMSASVTGSDVVQRITANGTMTVGAYNVGAYSCRISRSLAVRVRRCADSSGATVACQ